MLAIALLAAIVCQDSVAIDREIDIDTLDATADINAIDWLTSVPASLRLTIAQRDTAFRNVSYRLDTHLDNTQAGCNIVTPATALAPTGFWFQHQSKGLAIALGDVAMFSGTGLLLGSTTSGIRSLRSVVPPVHPEPLIKPWRARFNEPALRGGGITATFDSAHVVVGFVGGISLRDSVMSYAIMVSRRFDALTIGFNMLTRPQDSSLSASAWMRYASQRHQLVAEVAGHFNEQPSLQISYANNSPLLRVGLCAWTCGSSITLDHGSLLAISGVPRNTWGVAASAGRTIRTFVGWNVWGSIQGSLTRTYDTPFPTLEYALRTEVRQTVTSQLHVTWRCSATRDDDGVTIDGVRQQREYYRLYLQSTIERIIHPNLLWRLRADVRWLWDSAPVVASSTARLEVIWKPVTDITVRVRALHFASPSYRIASRVIDYTSLDLQRMAYCNGYGFRWSMGAHWQMREYVRVSLHASMTISEDQKLPTAELWLALSGQLSRAHDRHQPREESAEQ